MFFPPAVTRSLAALAVAIISLSPHPVHAQETTGKGYSERLDNARKTYAIGAYLPPGQKPSQTFSFLAHDPDYRLEEMQIDAKAQRLDEEGERMDAEAADLVRQLKELGIEPDAAMKERMRKVERLKKELEVAKAEAQIVIQDLVVWRRELADGSLSGHFGSKSKAYGLVHAHEAILEQLVADRAERYSLDKNTLAQIGQTPSEDNVARLRNGIRRIFRDLTNENLKALVEPKTQLFIYYDTTKRDFNYALNVPPDQTPHFRLTSGHIVDFAFVDGITLGSDRAIENMHEVMRGEVQKFSASRESSALSELIEGCLDKTQAREGLGYCYLAGVAKGAHTRQQILSSAQGRQSIEDDRVKNAVP